MQTIREIEEARYQMWASLLSHKGYAIASRNEKKKLKTEYRKMYHLNIIDDIISKGVKYETVCSLDSLESKLCSTNKTAPRKGNDNMYVEQNMTVREKTSEDTRREHFLDEIDTICCKRDSKLREEFGISVPKSPTSPKELVEWIKAGEFTFIKSYDPDDEEEPWDRYESPIYGIRWTKVKEDRKGYDAAYKSLNEERKKFKNEIWAELDPANFIKILEKFEKVKLH